jgi:four helix bundle protein
MGKIKSFKESIEWIRSMEFVTDIYKATNEFPIVEIYSLTSQIRNSAILVPSNICQGFSGNSKKDRIKYLQLSVSYLIQIQTLLEIAFNLKYLSEENFKLLSGSSTEIQMMLLDSIKKVNS